MHQVYAIWIVWASLAAAFRPRSGYGSIMARPPRDPRQRLERPGERPLLQGHLRAGGQSAGVKGATPESPEAQADEAQSAQPATESAAGEPDTERGKATRRSAKTATRPNLEGSEQGPT